MNNKEIKKVLWISRHEMTEEQLKGLEHIFGNIEITRYMDTIRSIDEIKSFIDESDIIAAVLPLELLCELVTYAKGKKVIQSVSARERIEAIAEGEPQFRFRHMYWQEITGIQISTKKYDF